MASTDIDGSTIVILSAEEAERVYEHFRNIAADWTFDKLDRQIVECMRLQEPLNVQHWASSSATWSSHSRNAPLGLTSTSHPGTQHFIVSPPG